MTNPGAVPRPPTRGAVESGRRLRLARLAAGLSQSQLAGRCGVSRQAVAGAEAGAWSPSLAVALALARALDTTVDQLFAAQPEPRSVAVSSLDSDRGSDRTRLALVWDRWVALPLTGDRATVPGFRAASGGLVGGGQARLWGSGKALVVAGCDPALPLMAEALAATGDGWTLEWWACSSQEASRLLDAGLVHAAAVHQAVGGRAALSGGSNRARLGFASWREGVVSDPRRAGLRSFEEVLARGLRWVNREPGSEARDLLDRELARAGGSGQRLEGYASRAAGHLQVASAVASHTAEAGIATEPAALAYGLRFLPLVEEECTLTIDRTRLETPELRQLLQVLAGATLGRELAALPGYDISILGQEL